MLGILKHKIKTQSKWDQEHLDFLKAKICSFRIIFIKTDRASLVTQVKNPPANVGDTDLIIDPGRSYMLWSN